MKDIPGYEGQYAATEDGKIWSHKRGKFLDGHAHKSGGVNVCINKRHQFVSRLVALTFVPNPDNLPLVLPINGDKFDARASNLRWAAHNEVGAAKAAKDSVTIAPGDRFQTNLDGEVEVVNYLGSKSIVVKFLTTGNEYNVQIQNLRAGELQDRDERRRLRLARQEAEQARKAAKIAEAAEKVARREAEEQARKDAIEEEKSRRVEAKMNRLVGQRYTDKLGMHFEVIAGAGKGQMWSIRYDETGNTYEVMEGWMLKGGVYDTKRADYHERMKAFRRDVNAKKYEQNREQMIAKASEYQRANKERTNIRNANRRARRINAEGSHTYEEAMQLLVDQDFKCVCCGESLDSERHLDHIMPLALGGSNWIENLQWLCPFCNLSKSDRHPDEWNAYVATPEFATRREARRIVQ